MFFWLIILLNTTVWGEVSNPRLFPGLGYTQDVKKEKDQITNEMVLPKEPPEQSALIKDILFDPKLEREFRDEYRKRFGQTEAEINFNAGSLNLGTSRFGDYFMYYGPGRGTSFITSEELIVRQRSFADYMMRRMFEYHGDRYARSREDLRPAYEMKEKIAKVNVAVRKGYKVNLNYSYSGKYFRAKLENPYDIELAFRYDLAPVYTTRSGKEESFMFAYSINPRVNVDGVYNVEDGSANLSLWRKLGKKIGGTLTYSTYLHNRGYTQQQSIYLVGFSWSE